MVYQFIYTTLLHYHDAGFKFEDIINDKNSKLRNILKDIHLNTLRKLNLNYISNSLFSNMQYYSVAGFTFDYPKINSELVNKFDVYKSLFNQYIQYAVRKFGKDKKILICACEDYEDGKLPSKKDANFNEMSFYLIEPGRHNEFINSINSNSDYRKYQKYHKDNSEFKDIVQPIINKGNKEFFSVYNIDVRDKQYYFVNIHIASGKGGDDTIESIRII